MHISTSGSSAERVQPSALEYEVLNKPEDFTQPENISEYFSLTATSNTRLGRRSPTDDELTAPMLLKRLRYPFILCETTVIADLQYDWDQGGLVIFAGGHPGQTQLNLSRSRSLRNPYIMVDPYSSQTPSKWARVALELIEGEICVSTLTANPKCCVDWASTPAFPSLHPAQVADISMPSLRVKLERVGSDLWIWYRIPSMGFESGPAPTPELVRRQWRKCREIVNFFDEECTKGDLWVGCYASRPLQIENASEDYEEGLFVEFEDLEIL